MVFLRKYSLDVKVFCYWHIAFILPSSISSILFENRDFPKITDTILYYMFERSYLDEGIFSRGVFLDVKLLLWLN